MRQELIKLIEQLADLTGWKDQQIENQFGSKGIVRTVRHGKNGPTLEMADRLEAWLKMELRRQRNKKGNAA